MLRNFFELTCENEFEDDGAEKEEKNALYNDYLFAFLEGKCRRVGSRGGGDRNGMDETDARTPGPDRTILARESAVLRESRLWNSNNLSRKVVHRDAS